ncbi:hypothetical protein RIF29_10340 [Crotalaria pallida]|uniref:Uncharacterized protein n=1 Tax=Crotalaria pallida TaxID=3830 RepID=A0AAN9FV54_CROPI
MDEGESGDQFHRNEAISAVADDGFLAEEDDDYDDLYNDNQVSVGSGSGRIRVELGQPSVKLNQVEKDRIANDTSVAVQQPIGEVVGSVGNED